MRRSRRLLRGAATAAALFVLIPSALLLAYRFFPPPVTPLMLIRSLQGYAAHRKWEPLSAISPAVQRAVIASEDARFCMHHGFDWKQVRDAWEEFRNEGRLRGASTISMQTARNLVLWTARSYVRKGLEVLLTPLVELILGKRRILELYLNIVEWGDGVYGVEAASERYFHHRARSLSPHEAALLAAVLPNPHRWSPARPTAYIRRRAATIRERMNSVDWVPGAVCR